MLNMVEILLNEYESYWDINLPEKYDAYRSIDIYNAIIDSKLLKALQKSKLYKISLPAKLNIWVNPGETKYQYGLDQPMHILFKKGMNDPWRPTSPVYLGEYQEDIFTDFY